MAGDDTRCARAAYFATATRTPTFDLDLVRRLDLDGDERARALLTARAA